MNLTKIPVIFFLILIIHVSGCKEIGTWEEQEHKQIDEYIKSLGDTAYVLYPSGLYYISLVEGSGRSPEELDTVYFKYEAKFLDHVTWDTNDPITVPYKHVIGTNDEPEVAGVDEGLRYMKNGGKSKLLTPSNLAFGHTGVTSYVPGYTPLLWIIDIDSVKAGPGK